MKRFALILGLLLLCGCPSSHDDFGGPRSGKWPAVRAAYLAEHGECEACGKTADLNVHHVLDFSRNPDLELDPENLITLCETDHLVFGHFHHTQWPANPNVRQDARDYRQKLEKHRP